MDVGYARPVAAYGTVMVLIGAGWFLFGAAPVRSERAAGQPTQRKVSFNREIRPILSDRCFTCHGPEPTQRQAGLRLDLREGALGPLGSDPARHAFVPGKPEQSEAYRRIISSDPHEMMPPPKALVKLDDREKGLIRRWIEQGAEWQEHWAFVKPERPAPPAVQDERWVRNAIDRFILARLEQEGLKPSAEADKATLIRRVSLDLTGIPPTVAEVEAFLADPSPGAYEKVVDRLLASPRYGEQMAAQWLDYARYADSHGYQSDPERHMWRWRDWVINAFNANMPFDRFTVEQLAGDLLPNATMSQKIATGFNRNHRINSEGGVIPEEWRIEAVADRVETTGTVWLGLTMNCARCHDHKYDPITQKEFYQLSAFFNSIAENGSVDPSILDKGINATPVLKVPTAEQEKRQGELAVELATNEGRVKELEKRLPEAQKQWEADGARPIEPVGLKVAFGLDGTGDGKDGDGKAVTATVQGGPSATWVDGRFGKAMRFDGKAVAVDAGQAVNFDRTDAFSFGCWAKVKTGGTLISRMDEPPSHRGWDLTVIEGRLMVHLISQWDKNAIRVVMQNPLPKDQWIHVMATYDGKGKAGGVKIYVDGKVQPVQPPLDALSDTIQSKSPLLIGRRVNGLHFDGAMHDVRIYGRALGAHEVLAIAAWPSIEAIVRALADKRNDEQKKALGEYVAGLVPGLIESRAAREETRRQIEQLEKSIGDVMVMEELPKPRETFLLIRGQYDQRGQKVEPGVPRVLPPMPPGEPMNRLGLARWIVHPDNPLTARVLANRLWDKSFGVGLVKTVENVGTQSEWPSHPDLLDWLACELIRLKWDLKAFQKLIVMSAAYRQSSVVGRELLERDPENRLIARGPRVRLNAEAVRDQALAVSGLLVEKIGGPSVKPYQPKGIWDGNMFGNLAKYVEDEGEGLYRRSLYSFWKRTAAPPNLTLFDMSTREFCVVKRSRTNTPLQALALLNEITYLEAARVLAEKMMTEGGATPAERIAYGFRRVTCREPNEREMGILLAGFERRLTSGRDAVETRTKLLGIGRAKVNEKLDRSELTAYMLTASVILNLDETVTRP